MKGIEKITEKIIAEAKAAEASALADAHVRADAIVAEGEREADEVRDRVADRAEREGESIISRAKSAASLARRNADLAVRGELIDETFARAFAQIRTLPDEEYRDLLRRHLIAALMERKMVLDESRARGDEDIEEAPVYEVVLNDRDSRAFGQALVDEVRRSLRGRLPDEELAKLTLAEKTAKISGGVILRCGYVESNCSLETLFAQARETYEAEVTRILFT